MRFWGLAIRAAEAAVWRVKMREAKVVHWVVSLEMRSLREATVVSVWEIGDVCMGEEGGWNLMV